MRKVKSLAFILAVVVFLSLGSVFSLSANDTEEETGEKETTEGFVVKKLPYGVEVVLEADKSIQRAWTKNFTFDIDYNWEDDSSYATTGFWLGNGITSYWLTYSKDLHIEDPGRASFSFSWTW